MGKGKVLQIIGAVVDVVFPDGNVPSLYNALTVTNKAINDEENNLVLEVLMHLGENTVKTIVFSTLV